MFYERVEKGLLIKYIQQGCEQERTIGYDKVSGKMFEFMSVHGTLWSTKSNKKILVMHFSVKNWKSIEITTEEETLIEVIGKKRYGVGRSLLQKYWITLYFRLYGAGSTSWVFARTK